MHQNIHPYLFHATISPTHQKIPFYSSFSSLSLLSPFFSSFSFLSVSQDSTSAGPPRLNLLQPTPLGCTMATPALLLGSLSLLFFFFSFSSPSLSLAQGWWWPTARCMLVADGVALLRPLHHDPTTNDAALLPSSTSSWHWYI
jgi:hypothetical protein